MYSRKPRSPEAVAIAHAIKTAYFRQYSQALEYVRSVTLSADSPLWLELQEVLYISYRGTGDTERAQEHYKLFDDATAHEAHQNRRLYLAKQVLTHFHDADVAAYLVQSVTDPALRDSRAFTSLAFFLKVAQEEAPLHEQFNFLWRARVFEPDEDWMAQHIINENDDPAILKRVIELLDGIKEKAEPGYGDAIENRKAQAYLKLKSL